MKTIYRYDIWIVFKKQWRALIGLDVDIDKTLLVNFLTPSLKALCLMVDADLQVFKCVVGQEI